MQALLTKTKRGRVGKAAPYNRKQAIQALTRKFKHPFEIKEDAVDLREMARNYEHDLIPLEDIQNILVTVLGPRYQREDHSYDPSGGAQILYTTPSVNPRFSYVPWEELYLWPLFQRDIAPNHAEKIFKDFDHTAVIVPCAIKITLSEGRLKGRSIYCVWDGHHTTQVCRLQGYSHFPVWYIDVDNIPVEQIEAAGFGVTDADRISYGAYLAGTNMRRINGKNKRPLSAYDDFMIGVETRDAQYVSMMNILRKNDCLPRRHATCAGAFTQIKSGVECYELADDQGVRGRYWDRALRLHRKTWPASPLVLEIFRPLSYLYQRAELEGFKLDSGFDDEFAAMLKKWRGDPESIQQEFKDSFWAAYTAGKMAGQIPDIDKDRVLEGMLNFYQQRRGQYMVPAPRCQWKV